MTEAEAKKILEYLTRRIQRSFSACINNPTALKITKNEFDDIIVEYKYTAKIITGWRFLWANDKYNPRVVQLKGNPTSKNIVKCLLEKAKDCDIDIDLPVDSDLQAGRCIELSKGESLEELKIKMDLEDV